MGTENFSASNGWISCFKQCHSLVFKKLARESAALDINSRDLWFDRLPERLEGNKAQDIYNGPLFQLPARPNAGTERKDQVRRSDSRCYCAQTVMAQTNKYPSFWKVHETMVLQNCKEVTCDVVYQLESVDDIRDFQRLSLGLSVCV
jgi:hypothetical protein